MDIMDLREKRKGEKKREIKNKKREKKREIERKGREQTETDREER